MNDKGQILVGVIVMMIVMAIIVPMMVMFVQNESKWGLKQGRNMTAFQVAEAGIDRGYNKIAESTTTWNSCQSAICPTYYLGDRTYDDIAGGTYKIYISSGPKKQQVTIISVAKETSGNEVRAIKAVYANTPLGNTAVRGKVGVTVGGTNTQVEWGAIVSGQAMNISGLSTTLHPQFWSASSINPYKTSNSEPRCDSPNCVQWHAYQGAIPPLPDIDLGFYASTAAAQTGCPAGGTPAGSCYYNSNQSWGGPGEPCDDDTECATGGVYYINGNLTISSNGIYVKGSLIVTGNLSLPNGRAGQGGPFIQLPQVAWQQYGRDWSFYTASGWDPTAPTEFPGLESGYLSPEVNLVQPTICMTGGGKVVVNGFTYVSGTITQTGGGGKACFYGAMLALGSITTDPNNIQVFYTDEGGEELKSTQVILSRISWQNLPNRGF